MSVQATEQPSSGLASHGRSSRRPSTPDFSSRWLSATRASTSLPRPLPSGYAALLYLYGLRLGCRFRVDKLPGDRLTCRRKRAKLSQN